MPTAPRYSSAGTIPGPMNAPEVRPALGTAKGLEAIGDTIAGLGRTAAGVMDSREKQAAIAERQAKIKEATDEATASEALDRRTSRINAARVRYDADAQGGKIGDADAAFREALKTNPEMEGLSGSQQAAFMRKASLQDYDQTEWVNAQSYARSKKFNEQSNTADYQLSFTQASYSMARGDAEGTRLHSDEAWRALSARAALTGEKLDRESFVADLHLAAINEAIRADVNSQAIKIYDSATKAGAFGKKQTAADKMIAPAKDIQWADDTSKILAAKHVDSYNKNTASAHRTNFSAARGDVASIQTTPERKERLLRQLDDMEKQQDEAIKQRGVSMMQQLERAQQVGNGEVERVLDTDDWVVAFNTLTPDQQDNLQKTISRGPSYSEPTHVAALEDALAKGALTLDAVQSSVLSTADREKYRKAATEPPPDNLDMVRDAVHYVRSEGGVKYVPRNAGKNDDDATTAELRKQQEIAAAVNQELQLDSELRKSFQAAPGKAAKEAVLQQHIATMMTKLNGPDGSGSYEDLMGANFKRIDTPNYRAIAGVPPAGPLTMAQRQKMWRMLDRGQVRAGTKEQRGDGLVDTLWDAGQSVSDWLYLSLEERDRALGFRP